jgi:hypothetical protein
MLAQLGGDRVGHDLAAMDFGGLAPVNSGMPIRVWVAVDGHSKIASADPLLHDLFSSAAVFFCLSTRRALFFSVSLAVVAIRHSLDRVGDLKQLAGGLSGPENGRSAANFIESFQSACSLLRLG